MASPANMVTEAAVEAARYALLRRLAPSMRHHLVVNLQPIGMVYEIMDRRLRAAEPNLAEVHDSAQKINAYARAALASCVDMVTWLAPDENARFSIDEAMKECLALVATSFTFRGFALRSAVGEVDGHVSRAAFRNVVTGALVYLSDERKPPAEILIETQPASGAVDIVLTLHETDGDAGFATAPTYRPITWGDVQALAQPEGVTLRRDGDQVRITLPV